RQALAELVEHAAWADAVLVAGDFGRNSETAILLESFIKDYSGQLTLVQDTLDYFIDQSPLILNRPQTLIVPTFAQLQKLAAGQFATAFTSTMDFLHIIDALHELTRQYEAHISLRHVDTIFVAVGGEVSTTKPANGDEISLAAYTATWWLQNPSQPFEAIT